MKRLTIWTAIALCALSCVVSVPASAQSKRAPAPHKVDHVYRTPRHNHTFQQIKFTESGRADVTPGEYIEEGDIGYFPRGAYYGPQAREKDTTTIACQFGFNGEHQRGHFQVAAQL